MGFDLDHSRIDVPILAGRDLSFDPAVFRDFLNKRYYGGKPDLVERIDKQLEGSEE